MGKEIKVDRDWFLDHLAKADLSQRQMAKKIGVTPVIFSRLLLGKRKIGLDEASKIAEIFQVPYEDVLIHAGVQMNADQVRKKLKITYTIEGDSLVLGKAREKGTALYPAIPVDGIEACLMRTHGTKYAAIDGAIVYFKPESGITVDAIGKLNIVDTEDYGLVFREIRKGYRAGTFNLYYPNGEIAEESVKVRKASPVLWMKL